MVFCCSPLEFLDPEEGTSGGGKLYPGQRRAANSIGAGKNYGHEGEDLVPVTVPEGVEAGQLISVMAPDGTRRVKATVPPGVRAGETFLVRLAKPVASEVLEAKPLQPPQQRQAAEQNPHNNDQQPSFSNALDEWLTPTPGGPNCVKPDPAPVHIKQHADASQVRQVPGRPVNANVEAAESRQETLPGPSSPKQKFVLVHVPPGMPAGSSLQVEIPGENRTLTAQVPPGVKSFHVAYSPRTATTRRPSSTPPSPPPVQKPAGRKLLLVRVPPGTNPGSTLHVSIPDEPGRILAAQVPPGNVPEFHVSYVPRQPKQHQQPPRHHQQQYQQQRPANNNYGGAGDYMLPMVGGAALGAAAMATYDHFAYNQQPEESSIYDTTGGDDFGGGGFDY